MARLDELRALLVKITDANGPSRELDRQIGAALDVLPSGAAAPAWSASSEASTKLFEQVLRERPMDLLHDPDREQYICTVKLYGHMPETAPYVVKFATTAPIAILAAMIETLIAVEIDWWV